MQKDNFKWTIYPGCYEYHLRCRYQNPLFPAERREITEEELLAAQERDANEKDQFREEVKAFVIKMTTALPPQPLMEVENLLASLKRCSELLERSGQIGGGLREERTMLTEFFTALDHDLGRFSEKERGDAKEHYQKLRDVTYGGVEMLINGFIAQMAREQSPILPKEVAPRLLSENIDTIRGALAYLSENSIAGLQSFITEILDGNTRDLDSILEHDPGFRGKADLILSWPNPGLQN